MFEENKSSVNSTNSFQYFIFEILSGGFRGNGKRPFAEFASTSPVQRNQAAKPKAMFLMDMAMIIFCLLSFYNNTTTVSTRYAFVFCKKQGNTYIYICTYMHIQHLLMAETSRHKFTMSGFIELSRSTFQLSALAFFPPTKNNKRSCKAEQIYRSPSHWPSHIFFHSEPPGQDQL